MPFGSPTPKEDVEGQKGSERPSSTTTTTPELVINMNVPDEDTRDSVDMACPTPPRQVSPDGSGPPPVVGGAADPKKESESPPTSITTPELSVVVSPDGSRPPPVVGGAADPKKDSESPPTSITTPELSVVVTPDGSRLPPVLGGVADPKESESPPTTITTPELDLPAARTSPLPSTSTTPPDEIVHSSQVNNLDMFKDDEIDFEDLMVAECSNMTQAMRNASLLHFQTARLSTRRACSLLLSLPPRKLPRSVPEVMQTPATMPMSWPTYCLQLQMRNNQHSKKMFRKREMLMKWEKFRRRRRKRRRSLWRKDNLKLSASPCFTGKNHRP